MKNLLFFISMLLMIFSSIFANAQQNEIESFKKMVLEQEDQLFGISLYYQGILYLYSDNDQIVQTNRRAYENIMERGERAIKEAKRILKEVQKNPKKINLIRKFQFPPIRGASILEETTKRAKLLVETYNELFPGRPKGVPLTEEENLKLMEAVVNKFK